MVAAVRQRLHPPEVVLSRPRRAAPLLVLAGLLTACSSSSGADAVATQRPLATRSSTAPSGAAITLAPAGALVLAVIGDYGSCAIDCSEEQKVADMVHSWNPSAIVSVGDNTYSGPGKAAADMIPYAADITSGRFLAALGNEDYGDACSQTAVAEVTQVLGRPRHFVAALGGGLVDLFVADTECGEPDGFTPDSGQAKQLQAQVAASVARWRIVAGHRSPFSSGPSHGTASASWLAPPGTDLVLTGHDHNFEELVAGATHYVIDGAGGHGLHPQCQPACSPFSVWRDDTHFGAVRLVITQNALRVEYVATGGVVLHTFTLKR